MRTTITFDERLLAQLKRRAAESGVSVSKLVEQAVRLFIRTPRTPAAPRTFELVTFGACGSFTRHNIDKTSRVIEADDLDRFGSPRWQMQLPDVNVLIYAHREDAAEHERVLTRCPWKPVWPGRLLHQHVDGDEASRTSCEAIRAERLEDLRNAA